MREVFKAKIDGYLLDADVRLTQTTAGMLDAESIPELIGRDVKFFAKQSGQMIGTDMDLCCQLLYRKWRG
jgi:hypothetical protein